MGRKNLFSLIEIAVAMAVASIGVAAIMALLPLTIKSSSDSVGDTLATDAANTVIANIEDQILRDFDVVRNLPPYPTLATFKKSHRPPDSDTNYEVTSMRDIPDDRSFVFTQVGDGHWRYYSGPSGETSDFGADVWCWQDNTVKLTRLDDDAHLTAYQPEIRGLPALVRVYIEISWPITKPYYVSSGKNGVSPRETRLFVREFFDPRFTDAKKD